MYGIRSALPVCPCCGQEISSDLYLDLHPFGLVGSACESCVNKNLGYTQDLEEV